MVVMVAALLMGFSHAYGRLPEEDLWVGEVVGIRHVIGAPCKSLDNC